MNGWEQRHWDYLERLLRFGFARVPEVDAAEPETLAEEPAPEAAAAVEPSPDEAIEVIAETAREPVSEDAASIEAEEAKETEAVAEVEEEPEAETVTDLPEEEETEVVAKDLPEAPVTASEESETLTEAASAEPGETFLEEVAGEEIVAHDRAENDSNGEPPETVIYEPAALLDAVARELADEEAAEAREAILFPSSDREPVPEDDEPDGPRLTLADPAGEFFASLPWRTTDLTEAEDISARARLVPIEPAPTDFNTAGGFFASLPWGSSSLGNNGHRVVEAADSFAPNPLVAGWQSALHHAGKIAVGAELPFVAEEESRASVFFNRLPWNR